MKKLYIFDMGGVVARNCNILPDLAAHLGASQEDVRDWGKDLFFPLMEGKLSAQRFWEIFSQRSGLRVEEGLFAKFFNPVVDDAVHACILKLKARHRVICGTNTIAEHYAIHCKRGDYQAFDLVYASHRMGVAKPDREFYRHIIEKEKFSPAQIVFIDDRPENVEAARALGIHALHFTGGDHLREQLDIQPFPAEHEAG